MSSNFPQDEALKTFLRAYSPPPSPPPHHETHLFRKIAPSSGRRVRLSQLLFLGTVLTAGGLLWRGNPLPAIALETFIVQNWSETIWASEEEWDQSQETLSPTHAWWLLTQSVP